MKLLRTFLCGCMVAAGSITLVGCGEQKSEATPNANPAPQLPADTTLNKKDNISLE